MTVALGCQQAEKPSAEHKPAATPELAAEPKSRAEMAKVAEGLAPSKAQLKQPAASAVAQSEIETPIETPAAAGAKTAANDVEPVAKPGVANSSSPAAANPALQSAQPTKGEDSSASKGFPSKAEIINSPEFRRAIFEFNEWLSSQPIYTPQQVAQIKDQFNHRVAEMNAEELTYLLNDLEAKMQLINTPEARDARAWMAQYLSVMSDRKRAEVLKDVPNVATMTAAQLSSELSKIQEKRAVMDDEQSAFQKGQAAQVAQQVQTDRINQQNYIRDWNTGPVAYSPYSGNGSNVNQRLNNTPIGAGMTFYTGGWGGVGVSFSPSAW
jgi:hypothetical protein